MNDPLVSEAIRDLHARYADAAWRQDVTAFGNCFTEDAEWRISGMVFRGREEIMQTITKIFSNYRRIFMTFRTPILEVGDGTASSRTYITEKVARVDGGSATSIGTYFERFVKEADQWRFSWRLFQLEYYGPPDLSGTFYDHADYGPPPAMPPLDVLTENTSGSRWGMASE